MTGFDGTVAEMLAYAFSGHRSGSSGGAAAHRESFVEWCIRYACKWDGQGQLLLDAIHQGRSEVSFDHLDSQIVDHQQPGRRPDLRLWYRSGRHERRQHLLIELKIDAALTPAQNAPGYAQLFLCSSSQKSKIVHQLEADSDVRVMTWNNLFEQISKSPRAKVTDLSLWELICSLGEELAREIRELEPLPSPRVLFDEAVADNYCAAMNLLGDILESLGHMPLMPPKPTMQSANINIAADPIGGTSLLFSPESRSSPISVTFADHGKYQSILEAGAQHSYISPKSGETLGIPLKEGAARDDEVYFAEQLAAVKWGSLDSAAGVYIQLFLLELRNIYRENADISMDRVPLTDCSVGYLIRRGERRVYALLDTKCWLQKPHHGPFVVRREGGLSDNDATFILEGTEMTARDVQTRIRKFVEAEIGLQSSDGRSPVQ